VLKILIFGEVKVWILAQFRNWKCSRFKKGFQNM